MFDILVYGASFAGCAAALNAATNAPDKTVLLICPDPIECKLGGIGTIGGQNFFDTRKLKGEFPQRGSFERWHELMGDFYNTDSMSQLLMDDLNNCPNIHILYRYDIEAISYFSSQHQYYIKDLKIRKIFRDKSGYVRWASICTRRKLTAKIFIDGSNDGKLTRLTSPATTVGRFDWPCKYLDCSELLNRELSRQQVATLMFKVTGIENKNESGMNFTKDKFGSNACWGGIDTYRTNPVLKDFNNKYGPRGYAIKPVNAAQNGADSKEWWVNTFLVFNVDGKALERDKNTNRYPKIMRNDYKNVDEAWIDARNFLKTNSNEFLNALRQYPGFSNVDFVYSDDTFPVVGDVLYLRETIHLAKNISDIRNDTENSNYNLTAIACTNAGDSCNNGADAVNYGTKIGLGYYWTDINAYKFEDLKDSNGDFVLSIVQNVRPDTQGPTEITANPVYIPYESLTSKYTPNLLVPGYAFGCSSFAWAEMRVIPNLCVLGDAAGVAAAYAVNNCVNPSNFSSLDILNIQNILVKFANVRLDKY